MKTSILLLLGSACIASAAQTVSLSDLDLTLIKQGWGQAQTNLAVTGKPMAIGGVGFTNGVGTHARSMIWIDLKGTATRFEAKAGVDDNVGKGKGSVVFSLRADGRELWKSGTLKSGDPAADVSVDLKGVRHLALIAGDAGNGVDSDHADWADAVLTYEGNKPVIEKAVAQDVGVLTPPPPEGPRINGADRYGGRPGHPLIHRIPCTGKRPIAFTAENLPATLKLDPATGIVTGTMPDRGEQVVTFVARNAAGVCTQRFTLVSGDQLALTPTMGWNHWYAHYNRITDAMMRRAADLIVESGMADAGYQYVSIDDCWMNAKGLSKYQTDPKRVGPVRTAEGRIVPNSYFPDMKALADHIHAKGLKAGIYTSPGQSTCAGFEGALGHEEIDAQTFAGWGFDLLKYDWCSYGRVAGKTPDLAAMQKPYRLMGDLLKRQDRDLVLNLCQYGMGDVWKWGGEVGGHSWRTGGDLGFELHRIFDIALKNCALRDHNKPGHWNDPDYIQIGWIGSQRGGGFELPHPSELSVNEQHSFMALWCLMACPLFYSGELEKLDDVTLSILCNTELIAVNQDPLGQCARIVRKDADGFVLAKELSDGSLAVGLANTSEWPVEMAIDLKELGVAGPRSVRDLWRQKDEGARTDRYAVSVPPRFVHTIKLTK